MSSNAFELATRAVSRAIRNKRCGSRKDSGAISLSWVGEDERELVAVLDPEAVARERPEDFVQWLLSTAASVEDWAAVKFLPKRLRPTKPEKPA
jgi:hypothetical protein